MAFEEIARRRQAEVSRTNQKTTQFGTRSGGHRLSLNRVENAGQLTLLQKRVVPAFFGRVEIPRFSATEGTEKEFAYDTIECRYTTVASV